ncbi:MAG: hypothetical protein AAF705_17470 [Bacteroidota bacterium]
MKIKFENRLEAIEWIANFAKDEGQFEVLREQLNYNHIYSGTFYLDLKEANTEVVLLDVK